MGNKLRYRDKYRVAASVAAALCGIALYASEAAAQAFSVVSVGANQPNFGVLGAAGSGVTIYRITPEGLVSVIQGGGGRAQAGTRTGATVTLRCTPLIGSCSNAQATLKLSRVATVSGRAQAVSNFTVSSTDLAVDSVATQADGSLQLRLTGFTNNTNDVVYVGMDLPILGDDSSTATTATARWTVGIANWPLVPSLFSSNGTAVATVRKSLSATTTPIAFGSLTRPDTGSGFLSIDPATGVRTAGGGDPPVLLNGGAVQRGTVVVSGQPSTTFTITLPATFDLSNGTTTLTATPLRTATGTLTLSAAGAYTLGVGATIPLSTSTTTGLYNGLFPATVAYN